MLKNYLIITLRQLIKNPFYSLVNILGLAIGFTFCILIVSFIYSEWNVNRELKNSKQQYIIQSKWKNPNLGIELTSFGPLAKTLKEQYPSLVKNYYRWDGITSAVTKGDKAFREGIQVCDSTIFDMYGFELLSGDAQSAFEERYSLIITDEKAKKYFNRIDVVGESLSIENFSGNKHDFIITGVIKKPERNSVTWINEGNNNQFFISSADQSYFGRNMDIWQNQYIASYLELQSYVSPAELELPIKQLIDLHVPPDLASNVSTYLVPLNKYYLAADDGLRNKMIYTLAGVAFFIILMALINFINLTISRSTTRLREISIRKVMGGQKNQIISQFLIEFILTTLIALMAGIFLAEISNPYFGSILERNIPSLFSFNIYGVGSILLGLTVLIGIIAGIYPAIRLTTLKTVDSLKGKFNSVAEKKGFRKSLVGLQFAIAFTVFSGALIIAKQVDYFFNKDLGFDKDFIVTAQLPRDWTPLGVQKMFAIRNQFALLPEVKSISLSYEIMDGNSSGGISLYRADRDSTYAVSSNTITSDPYFSDTYSISMLAGTYFDKNSPHYDSTKIVINESQSKSLGWTDPQQALNKNIRIVGNPNMLSISGVSKDFNFGTFSQAIQPITFLQTRFNTIYRFFSFKLHAENINHSLVVLQEKWNTLMPGTPFEYSFMDEKLSNLYKTELQLKKASYVATILSIIIVFLGVLGLVGISMQKRFKEIGIRKVLGSSIFLIIFLFLKEFLLILFFAGIVATPIAYMLMKGWLKTYVYRIDLNLFPFMISIAALGILSVILIIGQTIRVARRNPVLSLRDE